MQLEAEERGACMLRSSPAGRMLMACSAEAEGCPDGVDHEEAGRAGCWKLWLHTPFGKLQQYPVPYIKMKVDSIRTVAQRLEVAQKLKICLDVCVGEGGGG